MDHVPGIRCPGARAFVGQHAMRRDLPADTAGLPTARTRCRAAPTWQTVPDAAVASMRNSSDISQVRLNSVEGSGTWRMRASRMGGQKNSTWSRAMSVGGWVGRAGGSDGIGWGWGRGLGMQCSAGRHPSRATTPACQAGRSCTRAAQAAHGPMHSLSLAGALSLLWCRAAHSGAALVQRVVPAGGGRGDSRGGSPGAARWCSSWPGRSPAR